MMLEKVPDEILLFPKRLQIAFCCSNLKTTFQNWAPSLSCIIFALSTQVALKQNDTQLCFFTLNAPSLTFDLSFCESHFISQQPHFFVSISLTVQFSNDADMAILPVVDREKLEACLPGPASPSQCQSKSNGGSGLGHFHPG